MKFVLFGLTLIFFVSTGTSFGQGVGGDRQEYNHQLKHLNSRYKDFYLHRKAKERRLKRLLDAADSQRKVRKQDKKKVEKRRQAFVQMRSKKVPPKNYEPQHLKKMEKKKKRREKARRQFVERRKALEKIRESARHIPENEETGLFDPLEDLR